MVLNRPEMSSKRVGCDKKALFRHTEERLIKSLRTAIWGQIACPGNNNRKTTFLVTYCCPAINHLKALSHCHQPWPVQLLALLLAQHSAPWFPTSVQQVLHALIITQQGGMLLCTNTSDRGLHSSGYHICEVILNLIPTDIILEKLLLKIK